MDVLPLTLIGVYIEISYIGYESAEISAESESLDLGLIKLSHKVKIFYQELLFLEVYLLLLIERHL